MSRKTTQFIAFSCGYGAQITGTKDGPQFLQQALGIKFSHSTFCTQKEVEHLMKAIKTTNTGVKNCLNQNMLPVVIGGDHSCALATWSAFSDHYSKQKAALLWFDAHMDSHTYHTSPSKAHHGMPVASLMGHYTDQFNMGGDFIDPKNIYMIGIRSFEQDEEKLLKSLGVKIYYMPELKERGLNAILTEVLASIESKDLSFGLSLDLDYFDPLEIPAVGSPEKDGASQAQFLQEFKSKIISNKRFKCFEIAEFNPSLDKDNKTLDFLRNLLAIL